MFDKLQKLGEIKDVVKNVKEELKDYIVTVESENGIVKAEITGDRKIHSLVINSQDSGELSINKLQSLVQETLNEGLTKAEKEGEEMLQSRVKEHIPDIPGLDPKDFGIGS